MCVCVLNCLLISSSFSKNYLFSSYLSLLLPPPPPIPPPNPPPPKKKKDKEMEEVDRERGGREGGGAKDKEKERSEIREKERESRAQQQHNIISFRCSTTISANTMTSFAISSTIFNSTSCPHAHLHCHRIRYVCHKGKHPCS